MFGSKGEKHQQDVKNTYSFYDLCSSAFYFDNKIKGGTFIIMTNDSKPPFWKIRGTRKG
jgi:hypothetical protein